MKKALILASTLILIFISNYVGYAENVATEKDIIIKKHIQEEIQCSDEIEILPWLTEIMERYELDDNNIPFSEEDAESFIADLTYLRKYMAKCGSGGQIAPYIDQLIDTNVYHLKLRQSTKEGNESFFPMEYFKEKLLSRGQRLSVNKVKTKEGKKRHTKELRKRIFELMGNYKRNSPLNAKIIKKEDCGEYVMETITFNSRAGILVSGYLLIPKGILLPAPAIIALHQHNGEYRLGANEVVGIAGNETDQYYGKELAERGYVVLAIDALCFGRRIEIDEDYVNNIIRWRGESLFGIIIWDDLRSIDYLLTRKEVDPERIGCIGHSMGGARAAYLAALDERIKACVVSCYISSYKVLIAKFGTIGPPSTFLPGILKYADCQDVLSLIAPRALLITNGQDDDGIPLEGLNKVYDPLKRIYSIYNSEQRLRRIVFEGDHSFPESVRAEAYQWLDKWLKKKDKNDAK